MEYLRKSLLSSRLKTGRASSSKNIVNIADKPSIVAQLRKKLNSLVGEIETLKNLVDNADSMVLRKTSYRKIAERLALDLTGLEDKMSDYNSILDKKTFGDNDSFFQEIDSLLNSNEKLTRKLAWLLESKEEKELLIKSLEGDIDYEKHEIENFLKSLKGKEKEEYLRLKGLLRDHEELISTHKKEIDRLMATKQGFESDIEESPMKRKCLELWQRIRELKEQLKILSADENLQSSIKEGILTQIKDINREIREIEGNTLDYEARLKEISTKNEETCNSVGNDTNLRNLIESYKEKKKTLGDLRKRVNDKELYVNSLRAVKIKTNRTKNSPEMVMNFIDMMRNELILKRDLENLKRLESVPEDDSKKLTLLQKESDEIDLDIANKKAEIDELTAELENMHKECLKNESYLKTKKTIQEIDMKNTSISKYQERLAELTIGLDKNNQQNDKDYQHLKIEEYNDNLKHLYKINKLALL